MAFDTSAFWHKCNTMLLMSYEHLADRPKGDFRIDEAILFSFPEEDLIIIGVKPRVLCVYQRNPAAS